MLNQFLQISLRSMEVLMIRFLILTFLVSPFAYSNMDNICEAEIFPVPDDVSSPAGTPMMRLESSIQEQGCTRNNILRVIAKEVREKHGAAITKDIFNETVAHFCRFDRNVVIGDAEMTCVLYSNKTRESLKYLDE